jgi:hypothetical protein
MKEKIGTRVFSVLLAMLLVSMVMVPTVAAQANNEVSGDEALAIINELRGKDISMGEFYERITPVEFLKLPVEIQKEYYNTKMIWLELPKIGDTVQVIQHDASKLESCFIDILTTRNAILMRHISDIDASVREIDYRSESWVVFPPYLRMPYGEITSALCKLDPNGQTGTVIDYVYESDEGTYNLKAESSKTVAESGYYFTHGSHLFYAPPGFIYSPSLSHTQTNVIYVS